MPIGVAVGVTSGISFVATIGSDDNTGGSGELDEEVDDEGGAVKEGFKEVGDEPGLKRESPESFCNGGSVSMDDSSPEPGSDSADEPGISRRKDEFKL